MSFTKRVSTLLQYSMVFWRVTKGFRRRYSKYSNQITDVKSHLQKSQIAEYTAYWKRINRCVELQTISVCSGISGVFDKRIIPENIFVADIERSLISRRDAGFLSNKSIYEKWFKNDLFPKSFLHKIDGQIFDGELQPIEDLNSLVDIIHRIEYPVVLKPNVDTSGGADVRVLKTEEDLKASIEMIRNCTVQEFINQDDYFENINPASFNTVRIVLYRSVKTNKWVILHSFLRMGINGGLDNETAGGIVCGIGEDGSLNNYAVNKFGEKFFAHPNSKIKFEGVIPSYDDLCVRALAIANQLLYVRLTSLDMILDDRGRWRPIEVNLRATTIRFAQYTGKSFFGEYTDEVVDFCKNSHWTLSR